MIAVAAAILAVAEGSRRGAMSSRLGPILGSWRESGFHQTPRWHRLARSVKDRAGWRCEKCGKSGRLETDHRVPIATTGAGLAGQWDPANLQALSAAIVTSIKSAKERLLRFGVQTPKRSAWTLLVE